MLVLLAVVLSIVAFASAEKITSLPGYNGPTLSQYR